MANSGHNNPICFFSPYIFTTVCPLLSLCRGFTTADLMMWPFINRTHTALVNLNNLGYAYVLMRSATVTSLTPDIVIVKSDGGPSSTSNMVMISIQLPNSQVSVTHKKCIETM